MRHRHCFYLVSFILSWRCLTEFSLMAIKFRVWTSIDRVLSPLSVARSRKKLVTFFSITFHFVAVRQVGKSRSRRARNCRVESCNLVTSRCRAKEKERECFDKWYVTMDNQIFDSSTSKEPAKIHWRSVVFFIQDSIDRSRLSILALRREACQIPLPICSWNFRAICTRFEGLLSSRFDHDLKGLYLFK